MRRPSRSLAWQSAFTGSVSANERASPGTAWHAQPSRTPTGGRAHGSGSRRREVGVSASRLVSPKWRPGDLNPSLMGVRAGHFLDEVPLSGIFNGMLLPLARYVRAAGGDHEGRRSKVIWIDAKSYYPVLESYCWTTSGRPRRCGDRRHRGGLGRKPPPLDQSLSTTAPARAGPAPTRAGT